MTLAGTAYAPTYQTAILVCIDINLPLYSGIISHNMDHWNRTFKLEMHLGCLMWTGIGSLFWMVLGFILVSSIEAEWKANILSATPASWPWFKSCQCRTAYREHISAVITLQKFFPLFSPISWCYDHLCWTSYSWLRSKGNSSDTNLLYFNSLCII